MNYKALIKKQSTIIAIVVICLTIATIGVSYALFFQVETNTNNQVVTAGTLKVEYGSGSSAIEATELVPMSDDEALSSSSMTGTIYIENNGSLPAKYEVAIGNDNKSFEARENKSENDKLLSHDYLRVAAYLDGVMVVEPTTLSDLINSKENNDLHRLFEGSIEATGSGNNTATIVIKVWLSENAPEDVIGDYVYLKMDITSEVLEGNLKSMILSHAQKNNYFYTETPDFSKTTADGEYGLYKATDDYGLSYYFRGDVQNNYVQFGTYAEDTTISWFDDDTGQNMTLEVKAGTPMYWRIVRTNGDGSVRLIYDGVEKVANGVAHTAIISDSVYTSHYDYDGAKYVGYTFESTDAEGETIQADSTIKGVVDAWYDKHLESTYGNYIEDSIFCNDRSVVTEDANKNVYYASYDRLSTNKNPVLTCENKNDRYTVNDTTNGNGLLKNPIGLLTADEAAVAGNVNGLSNTKHYLYNGQSYWTMTPGNFLHGSVYIWHSVNGANISEQIYYFDSQTRPVINLKSNIEFVGDGSLDAPYQIKGLSEE